MLYLVLSRNLYNVSLLTTKLSENSTAKIYNSFWILNSLQIYNYNGEYKTKGIIKKVNRTLKIYSKNIKVNGK